MLWYRTSVFCNRTQKVISLSSDEAKVYTAISSACDGILIGRLIAFSTCQVLLIHHVMDSSAACGVLSRLRPGSHTPFIVQSVVVTASCQIER